jgi:hypothetical protein
MSLLTGLGNAVLDYKPWLRVVGDCTYTICCSQEIDDAEK